MVGKTFKNRGEDLQAHIVNTLIGTNYCPVCARFSVFEPFGKVERQRALCSNCKSVERHRFLFLILDDVINRGQSVRLLYLGMDSVLESNVSSNVDVTNIIKNTKKKQLIDLPSSEDKYDVIVCGDLFGRISDADLLIGKLASLLKDDGLFISFYSKSVGSAVDAGEGFLEWYPEIVSSHSVGDIDLMMKNRFDARFVKPIDLFSEEQGKLYSLGTGRYCIGTHRR